MDSLISFLRRWATLRNAVIALALFGLNAVLLSRLDQPLMERAASEPKLDLRFGYDVAIVQRLLDAYGEDGRMIYRWNLLVDTPFPILGSLAVGLFALIAYRGRVWQKVALVPPLTFAVTDLVENGLLFVITSGYPTISSPLVTMTSVITQVKRTAFYTGALELVLNIVVIAAFHVRKR